MTLVLAPQVEERLKQEAARCGLPPDEYANKVLDEHLSQAERERREQLIAMLQSWNEEEVDESEWLDDDFFRQLDEDRTSARKLFPPELKGISW